MAPPDDIKKADTPKIMALNPMTAAFGNETSSPVGRVGSVRSDLAGVKVVEPHADKHKFHKEDPCKRLLQALHWAQRNAVPVLAGLVLALIMANTLEPTYKYYFTSDICTHDDHHYNSTNATGGHRRSLLAGDTCHLDRYTLFNCPVFGHSITLHFVANDIVMAFFFGLAMKEVVEALLPGGSLNPPAKAINPLLTTLGGVIGPVAVYFVFLQLAWEFGFMDVYDTTLSELQKGWGIVTATDIVLAWLVARVVFGQGHPAIDYLLLLAVADDALGMVIIAIFYPSPIHPVEPVYLLIVVAGMFSSWVMRRFYYRKEHAKGPGHIQSWIPYIVIGGTLSWIGFIKAHLHPALSLCTIVPFMPSAPHHDEEDEESSAQLVEEKKQAERDLEEALTTADYATAASCKEHIEELEELILHAEQREEAAREINDILERTEGHFNELSDDEQAKVMNDYIKEQENRAGTAETLRMKLDHGYLFAAYKKVKVRDDHGVEHHQLSTLDAFEHATKVYVDFGLALFGFVNAGIIITGLRAMAVLIPAALLVGKFLGIVVMYKLAFWAGFRPPLGIHTKHICMIGVIASIGLVVAIFVSNVAFTDEELQGDAKLGAIISAFPCPIICMILMQFFTFNDAEDDIRMAAKAELMNAKAPVNEVLTRTMTPKASPRDTSQFPDGDPTFLDLGASSVDGNGNGSNGGGGGWFSCDGVRSRACNTQGGNGASGSTLKLDDMEQPSSVEPKETV